MTSLELPTPPDLDAQNRLTALLETAVPSWLQAPASEEAILAGIESALSIKVRVFSRGPTADDVARRHPD